MWKIHIRRGTQHFEHVAYDLRAAISVACLLLRDGIVVERLEGPEGLTIGIDAIQALCDPPPR